MISGARLKGWGGSESEAEVVAEEEGGFLAVALLDGVMIAVCCPAWG